MQKLELQNTNAATVSGAQASHTETLKKRYQPAMFQRNGRSIGVAFAIALVGIALAFTLSGGAGLLAIIGIMLLMIVVLVVFAILVKAPTLAGRKLLDEIEGLRTYLGVAERDELARMPGPDQPPMLDAKRYERLLPYAVALDVEDAWTKKFTLAVGAAAAAATTAAIHWYQRQRQRGRPRQSVEGDRQQLEFADLVVVDAAGQLVRGRRRRLVGRRRRRRRRRRSLIARTRDHRASRAASRRLSPLHSDRPLMLLSFPRKREPRDLVLHIPRDRWIPA